ncbi:hypothetical protein EV182_006287, partial [Spiromyces aspiralis]
MSQRNDTNYLPFTYQLARYARNDSASKASGKLAFELMDGTDRFHMVSIKDIKKDVNASDKLLTWTVPEDIPTSNNLSIRVTDEEGNQNYSSTFSGGGAPVKPKSGDQKKSEKDSASAHKDDKDYKSDKSDKSASKDKGSKKSKQSKHSASESASASETKSEHNSSSAEGTTAARAAEETGDAGEVKLSW